MFDLKFKMHVKFDFYNKTLFELMYNTSCHTLICMIFKSTIQSAI